MTEQRPPLPPFTRDSAIQKVRAAKMAGTAAMRKKSPWPTPWIANGATAANLSTVGGKLLSSCSENGARSSNTG